MTDHISNKSGQKWLERNLEVIRGRPSIDSRGETALLRTAHKRRKVLQSGT